MKTIRFKTTKHYNELHEYIQVKYACEANDSDFEEKKGILDGILEKCDTLVILTNEGSASLQNRDYDMLAEGALTKDAIHEIILNKLNLSSRERPPYFFSPELKDGQCHKGGYCQKCKINYSIYFYTFENDDELIGFMKRLRYVIPDAEFVIYTTIVETKENIMTVINNINSNNQIGNVGRDVNFNDNDLQEDEE